MKTYYVYIVTNKKHGIPYIGITCDLKKRIYEHKNKKFIGFTSKFNLDKLVYAEPFANPEDAINYEKKLKNWHHDWKIRLIEKNNPDWNDLSEEF